VSVSPPPGADGRFSKDSTVSVSEAPAPGYRFDGWGGDVAGNTTSITALFNGNKNITATFVRTHSLVTSVAPAGGGSVSPAGGTFDEGTNIIVKAIPAAGYRFDSWTGDASGNANPVTVNINADKSVTAHFVRVYTLNVSVSPASTGTVSPSTTTYDEGTTVTITAEPTTGYLFDHWGGDASGNTTTITVNMNADKIITAYFVQGYTLTVTASPISGGSVSPSSGLYRLGTLVALTATPAPGYVFVRWTGPHIFGPVDTITIIIDGDIGVIAVFQLAPP
jgi:uncharacterized repeat protein (TIGR02543 family)